MTNRDFYTIISKNEALSAEVREHADKLIAALDASLAKRKEKPSKTAIANEPIKAAIREYLMGQTESVTATVVGEAHEISTQKASALLRQLEEEGVVSATEVKVPKKGKQKGYKIKVNEGE